MTDTHLTEVFPAGEYLADELEARGWSHADFAGIIGRPPQFVSDIVTGKKEITRASAAQFAAALGTTPELWLNLQDAYHLWKQSQDPTVTEEHTEVERRARLRSVAPINILVKRGYVEKGPAETQEQDIRALLGPNALDGTPDICFAARRSNEDEATTITQRSWAACVRTDAGHLAVSAYDPESLRDLAGSLARRLHSSEDLGSFQELFGRVGVKLVYVEAFPRGKLDGCTFIDDGTPVIGLSGRGGRLDKVFFTLMHEVAHLLLDHVGGIDSIIAEELRTDGGSVTTPDHERDADALAAELIFPKGLPRIPDSPNRQWINETSGDLGVAPIVLIGRLQNDGVLGWSSTLSRKAPSALPGLELWV